MSYLYDVFVCYRRYGRWSEWVRERFMEIFDFYLAEGCSSANTLRIQRLEFGCEQLTKGPNVISQTCCHRWCALSPAGLNRAAACTLVRWQRLPQAHVRSGHIVEALEKDDPLPHALAVFTEAGRLTRQWGQGLTQGHVHPFDKGRPDRTAQSRQAIGAKHDACTERQQLALFLLFHQLPVDQSGMGLAAGLAWAPPLAGARKRRHHVEGREQGRQITREAITKERRDPRDACLGGGHNLLGSVERARPHDGRDHQPKLGGKADPDPLPSILAVRLAFTGRVRLTRMLARDKVPHLVELYLRHRQSS